MYEKGRGIVLNEPTVIALNTRTNDVLAMGHEAWKMIGRTPGHIVAVRPLRHGAITDFDVTERLIRLVLERCGLGRLGINKPRVLICVPSAITEVEKRAVEEATLRAGARGAYLIEQPMAAAIGAGLPIHEPVGSMVVDVGGGTSEVAVVSLGGIVTLHAIRIGSFDLDSAIQAFVRKEFGIAIGERTAEEIKLAIGTALPDGQGVKAEIPGRDLSAGLPTSVVVTTDEIAGAIQDPVDQIVAAAVECLGECPPELAQDILSSGVYLTGGGALLEGLDRRIARDTQVRAQVAELALESIVLGAGQALESFDLVRDLFVPVR